ncbi:MAG: hypothetical protein U5L06_08160 [Rhodovibrio sp.]|nr:hypothetical protein [Rhodovibrio sp.]
MTGPIAFTVAVGRQALKYRSSGMRLPSGPDLPGDPPVPKLG